MRGFVPRKHPAPGLQPGLHRKTTFCFFSQQPSFRRQPASILKLAVIFFTYPISAFRQPTSFHLSPIPADTTANQSAKITAKKSNKKKEAEASLRKITVRTYQLLPHNVQQLRSSCWYIPHTKTRPAAGTSWRNISFHQNVLRTCQRRSLL